MKEEEVKDVSEEMTPEEREAEDGFMAGFAKASGAEPLKKDSADEPTESNEDEGGEAGADENSSTGKSSGSETAKSGEGADEEADAESEGDSSAAKSGKQAGDQIDYQKEFNRLHSRFGSLLQKVNMLEQQGSARSAKSEPKAPTSKQVQAALKNKEKFDELLSDYPMFEPIMNEFQDLRREASQAGVTKEVRDQIVRDATNEALYLFEANALNKEHSDWKEQVRSDDFKNWSFENGPSLNERAMFDRARNDSEQGALIKTWAELYPEWWDDIGQRLFSDRPSDIHSVMDRYRERSMSANSGQVADKSKTQERNKRRLEQALSPGGSGESPTRGLSDDEAFERGFRRSMGR